MACSSGAVAPVITKIEQAKTDAVATISEWIAVAAEGREARKAKPAATKGIFLKKLSVSSTMGVGVKVDPTSLSAQQ